MYKIARIRSWIIKYYLHYYKYLNKKQITIHKKDYK